MSDTTSRLQFTKMHGCGNDFIMIDGRQRVVSNRLQALAERLCDRHLGLGADGIVVLFPPSGTADFEMRYVNASGLPGEMCGNGARCAARFAVDIGLAARKHTFMTHAGPVHAEVGADDVTIDLPPPSDCELNLRLRVGEQDLTVHKLMVGVPHGVTFVTDVANFPVNTLGPLLRAHPAFPAGCNANFAELRGGEIWMRTYERGVEAETLACGTGAVACATIRLLLGLGGNESVIVTQSGERLAVSLSNAGSKFVKAILRGPTETVSRGEIDAVYLERHGLI